MDDETIAEPGASGESWKNAKALATILGYVPSSFSSTIRLLVADDAKNDGILRPVAKYQIARLLNTSSFKSMLYYATKDLREWEIEGKNNITIGLMMNCFRPLDLAALVSCFIYYRKCRRLVGPEKWPSIEENLCRESLIGAQLGTAIPKISTGVGLLLGTMHFFGIAAMCLKDEKAFKEYRREVKKKNLVYNQELELKLFGTSITEVALAILSGMGFGVEVNHAYARAFDRAASLAHVSDELHFRMQIGRVWIESLLGGLRQPACGIPGHYYPEEKDFARLEGKVREILSGKDHFLSKTSADISPTSTPQLFVKPKDDGEVPAELAHIFSYTEIEKMGEDDFDKLVDHMDDENDGKVKPGTVGLSTKEISELEKMVE